jgi:hypothetical protein
VTQAVALAFVGALEGAVIALAGQAPHDELLAARAAAGVLGLDGPPAQPPDGSDHENPSDGPHLELDSRSDILRSPAIAS